MISLSHFKAFTKRDVVVRSLSILLIFQFLIPMAGLCQSAYDKGFNEGYKKGYCYEKVRCISPIPPIAPIPKIGESNSSYQDGYNRGFKMGLDVNKGNIIREGYKTSSSDTVINYMYKPTELETKIASKAQQNFATGMNRAQELFDEGKYSDCINLCNIISNMTHLVSYKYYNLISMSHDRLGNKGQSKKYAKKAEKFLEKH
jgi:hypothetical protein